MKQDAIGGESALRDDTALRGIDPKPAARGGGVLVVNPDGGLNDVAHAVADFEIGPSRSCHKGLSKKQNKQRRDISQMRQ